MTIAQLARLLPIPLPIFLMLGCGVTATPPGVPSAAAPAPPAGQACLSAVTGKINDSLTGVPVAHGLALLETGMAEPELLPGLDMRTVQFSEVSRAASDADGIFRICVPGPVTAPALVVFVAMDRAGKEYAPLVQDAMDAAGRLSLDLGQVSIGECYFSCAISSGVQSELPMVIEGVVTSMPAVKPGIVAAKAAIPPLDHTPAVWSVAIPGMGTGETGTFQTGPQTGAGACTGLCAPYRFTLPTRAPIVKGLFDTTFIGPSGPVTVPGSGNSQQRGFVGYVMYATASGCKYPFAVNPFVKGTRSYLQASSNATLEAGDLTFTECQ